LKGFEALKNFAGLSYLIIWPREYPD